MDKPQIIEHINHSVNYTLFGGRWVPASARCVLFGQHAKGTGALQVLAMEKGKLELQTEVTLLAPKEQRSDSSRLLLGQQTQRLQVRHLQLQLV